MNNAYASRKEFEEWIESEFIASHEKMLKKCLSGSYVETLTFWYWKAWQASRSKPIVLPRSIFIDDLSLRVIDSEEVKQAIEEAGYKYHG